MDIVVTRMDFYHTDLFYTFINMHMNPYRDRYIDLLTRILPQTYIHMHTHTHRDTLHTHTCLHTHHIRTHTGHNTHSCPHMLPTLLPFLGKKSSCPFCTQLFFPSPGFMERAYSKKEGDGEGAGEWQATWREANLFLQLTDGVRTNDTVGIKTPS